jgi:hypothetical protein
METPCTFSPDRKHRYSLVHRWNPLFGDRLILWIGLNPSTADEAQLDPTLTRIRSFSQREGFDGFWMANLFGRCTPYPKKMMDRARSRRSGQRRRVPRKHRSLREDRRHLGSLRRIPSPRRRRGETLRRPRAVVPRLHAGRPSAPPALCRRHPAAHSLDAAVIVVTADGLDAAIFPRSTSTVPATLSATPAKVIACQRSPSNAVDSTIATIGTAAEM